MKFTLSILFALLLFSSVHSQVFTKEEKLSFYPNAIGNYWSYWWVFHGQDYSEAGRSVYSVLKDTSINNVNYSKIGFKYFDTWNGTFYLERIDTISGNIYRSESLSLNSLNLVDNIYAEVGDTIDIANNLHLLYCDKMVILSIRDTVINGFDTAIREVIGLPKNQKLFFAKDIGMLGASPDFWIDSANVNGVIFANISSDITDIKENTKLVNDFKLYQNFPNPFNPITKIVYSVPIRSNVIINIYNSLGQKIETLVNKSMGPGTYSVMFNGDNYPSGLYIYQLSTGRFTIAKKLLLVK